MSDRRDGSDEELTALYEKRVEMLCELAEELNLPPEEAVQLIEDALFASMMRKGNLDADTYLAASLRLAAKRRAERAK